MGTALVTAVLLLVIGLVIVGVLATLIAGVWIGPPLIRVAAAAVLVVIAVTVGGGVYDSYHRAPCETVPPPWTCADLSTPEGFAACGCVN